MSMDEISTPEKAGGLGSVAAACVLAVGLGSGLYFVAQALEVGLTHSHLARVVSVVNSAERTVKACQGVWPIRIVAAGGDLSVLQAKIETDLRTTQDFLKAHGIAETALQVGPLHNVDLAAGARRVEGGNRFLVYGDVTVRSDNVDALYEAWAKSGDLAKAGVVLTEEGPGGAAALRPTFVVSKEAELKAELLAEAERAARVQAEHLVQQTGGTLDGFAGGEEVAPSANDEKMNDSPNKTVSVTFKSQYSIK